MNETSPLTMANLRGFGDRLVVVASSVDEAQRESGIIVPINPLDPNVKRGVVTWVPPANADLLGTIDVGTVVYFRHGTTIGDVLIVELRDVIAYESE